MALDRDANNPTAQLEPAPASETAKARKHRLRRVSGELLGGEHRTAKCGCTRCAEVVTVNANAYGKAGFKGVSTCGSIWTCPVCASKIAARRSVEVQELAKAHQSAGFSVYMATFTINHGLGDDVRGLRTTLSECWDQMTRSGSMKRLKDRFNIIGFVRALEVTHGQHGWHPHLHVLWFTKNLDQSEEKQVADTLFERWETVMAKRGHEVSRGAFDFVKADDAATAAEYVSKWGAGTEIAKGAEKLGRGSRSPWQLLDDAAHGDEWAGRLFADYARSFHRARHLTYARGLRQLYQLDDAADDEQLALMEDAPEFEDGGELYRFDKGTWWDVVRARLTGRVLDVAEWALEHDECTMTAIHELLIESGLAPSYEKPPSEFTGKTRKTHASTGATVMNQGGVMMELRELANG